MSKPNAAQARIDREAYVKAMISGMPGVCYQIEQKYALDGYPPELVCIGLSAASEGKDPEQAVADYIDNRDQDTDQMPADEWSDES